MAGAGAGARVEIMDKGGAEKEPAPNIYNFGSATLFFGYFLNFFLSYLR